MGLSETMGLSGACEAKKEPKIPQEISRLKQRVKILGKALEELETALAAVVISSGPLAGLAVNKTELPASALAIAISASTLDLDMMIERVRNLMRRLQV